MCVHVGLLVYVLSLFVFVFCAVCVRTAHTCLRTSLEFVDGSLSWSKVMMSNTNIQLSRWGCLYTGVLWTVIAAAYRKLNKGLVSPSSNRTPNGCLKKSFDLIRDPWWPMYVFLLLCCCKYRCHSVNIILQRWDKSLRTVLWWFWPIAIGFLFLVSPQQEKIPIDGTSIPQYFLN